MGQEASLPADAEALEEQGHVAPLPHGGMRRSMKKFRNSHHHAAANGSNSGNSAGNNNVQNKQDAIYTKEGESGAVEQQSTANGGSSPTNFARNEGSRSPPPPPPPPSLYSEPPQWNNLQQQQSTSESSGSVYPLTSTQQMQYYQQPPDFEHQSFDDAALQFGPPSMTAASTTMIPNSNHAYHDGDGLHEKGYPAQHATNTNAGHKLSPNTTNPAAASSNNNNNTPSKRGGVLAGRAGARGAALIQGMRNLNLSAKFGSKTAADKAPEGDWEHQWDADDDDEEEEEDEEEEGDYDQRDEIAIDAVHVVTPHSPLHQQLQQAPMQQYDVKQPPAQQQVITPDYVSMTTPPRVQQQQAPFAMPPDFLDSELPLDAMYMDKPDLKMFSMLRVLGKGSFGKVILVQKLHGKECGHLFAMKILRKTYLVKRRQIDRTRTERQVLSAVNHPFIMKLHYAFQTESKLYLVLDYCPGGELFFHLSRFRRFPERVARFFSAELLLAIGHLHKRGIIYRDLKPENVLIDADGHVKLGDFGLAKTGITHPCEGAISMCGTPEYMSPEILSQQGHGFCVDYWGLGMLTYEMMTGLPPWYTTDRAKLFRRLKSAPLDVPTYFSVQASDCVSALLERNPHRRLGVAGIRSAMEHDFYRSINWRALYARRIDSPIKPCEGWKPPDSENDTPGSRATSSVMDDSELDAATANFDNTFTRMPVESEDQTNSEADDAEDELNAETFLGFSFDGGKDLLGGATEALSSPPPEGRRRTHHIQTQPLG